MINRGLSIFARRRVLLLQGPVGPFFRRLARELRLAGAHVIKVDFNAGDRLFSDSSALLYDGSAEDWPRYFSALLDDEAIDAVMLFGDCRPLHRAAHAIAAARGIDIGVFEEGYVRPDFVTFERHGVNGHSRIPRDPAFYHALPAPATASTMRVGNAFWHAAVWAVLYYAAAVVGSGAAPQYRHHRPLCVGEALPWLRSGLRKVCYGFAERGMERYLSSRWSKRFFLVPLQVYNDAQIHFHSEFPSVEQFIGEVIDSFAANAPVDTALVIKHHPLDRGYHDYARFIAGRAAARGVASRVWYLHDQHLPTLLDHTRGVVVINSTVGLSALHHGAPLMVCGNALYDMKGLTWQGGLDGFWQGCERFRPDMALYERFRDFLIHHTQVNGSFYKRCDTATPTGLGWTRAAPDDGTSSGGSETAEPQHEVRRAA